MPSGLHVSTYAFNPGIGQYLYFFANAANNGATSNSWSAASGSGGGLLGASGAAGFLPLWTGATTLANSVVSQSNGNVGIGVTLAPLNQFQVGDTPGFSANQLALGNGAQAMSFALTAAASIWYGNTAFLLQKTVGDTLAGIGGIPTHNLDVFGGNAQIGLVNTANVTSATISKYTTAWR